MSDEVRGAAEMERDLLRERCEALEQWVYGPDAFESHLAAESAALEEVAELRALLRDIDVDIRSLPAQRYDGESVVMFHENLAHCVRAIAVEYKEQS